MVNAQNVKSITEGYDRVFLMERDIAGRLIDLGVEASKMLCLDVPDEGTDEQLREVLTEKLHAIFRP